MEYVIDNSQLPYILTANTFRWSPSQHASGRRHNEKKRIQEVSEFLLLYGFSVSIFETEIIAIGHGLRVDFNYRETCNNVYKSLSVHKVLPDFSLKKTNITALKKVLNMK